MNPFFRSTPSSPLQVALAATLLALSGCGHATKPTGPASAAPVARVVVNPPSATVGAGGTLRLSATPVDSNDRALAGRTVTWTSDEPAVASVTGSGLVTGMAAGSATITATSEGVSGTSVITVTAASAVPRLGHVVVVVLENTSYDQARTQPYISSLIAAGSVCTNYYAITHPSQPNYLALWAGSTLGVTDNTCPAPGSPFTAENLGHACEAAGLAWKSYVEDLPEAGSTICSVGEYTRKHHPCPDFGNVNHQNERPYSDLAVDLANRRLPDLALVIPNNRDNALDSGADAWLSVNLPPVLAALGSKDALILTWDEDDRNTGNHVLTVFVGPPVKPGYASAGRVDHYALLRTLCDGLGLAPFGEAANRSPITDVWAAAPPVRPTPWARLKAIYR